jgi:hypothetical protein
MIISNVSVVVVVAETRLLRNPRRTAAGQSHNYNKLGVWNQSQHTCPSTVSALNIHTRIAAFSAFNNFFFFFFVWGGPFVCVVCPQGYFGLVVALNGIARRERARAREWDRPEQQEAIRRQGEIAFTVSRSIPIWQGGL